ARHQAGGSKHASLPGANLIEQDLASGLRSLEHPRLAFDAHHVSLALLALAISDVALTEPVELRRTEQLRTMRFIELREIGKRRKPARDQIWIGHWRYTSSHPPRRKIATARKPRRGGPRRGRSM